MTPADPRAELLLAEYEDAVFRAWSPHRAPNYKGEVFRVRVAAERAGCSRMALFEATKRGQRRADEDQPDGAVGARAPSTPGAPAATPTGPPGGRPASEPQWVRAARVGGGIAAVVRAVEERLGPDRPASSITRAEMAELITGLLQRARRAS